MLSHLMEVVNGSWELAHEGKDVPHRWKRGGVLGAQDQRLPVVVQRLFILPVLYKIGEEDSVNSLLAKYKLDEEKTVPNEEV